MAGKLKQTFHADNATVKWVLDLLDARERPAGETEPEGRQRYPYRLPSLRIELRQHKGLAARYAVPARNIGRHGASILVGKLVYPETVCKIDLITTQQRPQSVVGKVARCEYVWGTGSIYETDVCFQRPIDLDLFIAQALRVRVLIADDSPAMRGVLGRMMREANADVVECENGREAVEQALSGHFDLILMDMEMPVLDGFAATEDLRRKGCVQPIVAVTGLTAPDARERGLRAGCDDYLTKPPDRQALTDLVGRLRPAPVVSSLIANHPELTEFIDRFVGELPYQAMHIQRSFAAGDRAAAEQEARTIKRDAPKCGFESIGEAAADLEDALRDSQPLPDVHVKLGKLVRLCCAARPAVLRREPPSSPPDTPPVAKS